MRVNSEGVPLFYDVRGEGPALVLLHPFPLSHKYWEPLAAHLEDGRRLILPDLRGHGLSGTGSAPATMETLANDILRVCEAAQVQRAVFFGCSIGCYVIWQLWRMHPECFKGMILSSTRAESDSEPARQQRLLAAEKALRDGPAEVVEAMLPRLLGETTKRDNPIAVNALRTIMLRSSGEGIAAVQRGMAGRPDSTETLSTITVPTLVFGGEEDILCPIEGMEAMAGRIRYAEFHRISHAGHLASYENPDAVLRIVRPFLENLGGC
jgi:pimeloyl-ACP methyl ester carboxylesterase